MLDYKMFSLRVSDETRFVIVAKCNTKYGTRMFIISDNDDDSTLQFWIMGQPRTTHFRDMALSVAGFLTIVIRVAYPLWETSH